MSTNLFPGFLRNADEYAAAEDYWRRLFAEILGDADRVKEWQAYRISGKDFYDERDGNPIFEACNARLQRALQVIQWEPGDESDVIGGWMKFIPFEDPDGAPPVMQVTLSLALTTVTAEIAREIISRWVAPLTSDEEMKKLLQERFPEPPEE